MPRTMLVILDGWGIAEDPRLSAPDNANIPWYRAALRDYPHSILRASEEAVGLPKGQMGNSEVGHMNLGAGRVVYQDLVRIDHDLATGELAKNPRLQALIEYCKQNKKPLHLAGLVSDGGVHSSLAHVKGLIEILAESKIPVYLHAFTDGRDTGPSTAGGFLRSVQQTMNETGCGKIVSVIGRYYAMDRDKRWERIKLAYDLLVHGTGTQADDAQAAVVNAYGQNQSDEFIKPYSIHKADEAPMTIQAGDAFLFFNFRTDRGRQLTYALTQGDPELALLGMPRIPLHFFTVTEYDASFSGIQPIFDADNLNETLGEVISKAGKTQIRIAETEKYPHVTFFFNGGREEPWPGEKRILIPSPKVPTYDLKPEMSAYGVTEAIIAEIKNRSADFICLNFANPDMVGHTGVMNAAKIAVETVDKCMELITQEALHEGYTLVVLSDHGNCDRMRNPDGSPHTSHTLARVHCILIQPHGAPYRVLNDGVLGDIAPTILELMGLPQPAVMSGQSLLVN